MKPVLEIGPNKPQTEFFFRVMAELQTDEDGKLNGPGFRIFSYGGAIRGGKTYVALGILALLARKYPHSRWHVIRKTFPDLKRTAIPSMEKLLMYTTDVKWSYKPSDYYVQFPGGGRVYFMAESANTDPQRNRFKGLETNGMLFEQAEEIDHETYDIGISRLGSWYVDPMPPALSLLTFNPTAAWPKSEIFDKWVTETLEHPHHFTRALPADNPFVTKDQWEMWKQLDPQTYAQMIEGSWDIEVSGIFAHQFNTREHCTTGMKINKNIPLRLSFDFNVDPMTCTISQTNGRTWYRVIDQIRIPNADTYVMCREITKRYKAMLPSCQITGDATGRNRIAGTRGHINHWQIILAQLDIRPEQLKIPTVNPGISESRVLINSLIHTLQFEVDEEKCPDLVKDLQFVQVEVGRDGHVRIVKTGKNPYCGEDNEQMGHLLDCVRYDMHVAFLDYLTIPQS